MSNSIATLTETTQQTDAILQKLEALEASITTLSENLAELTDKLNDMELSAQYAGEGYSILEGQG